MLNGMDGYVVNALVKVSLFHAVPVFFHQTEGSLDPVRWANEHGIDLVFRSISAEKYREYEIKWIKIPSFRRCVCGEEFDYSDRHGVILYHKDLNRKLTVGFIARWSHKGGPCRIYILTANSKEWGGLLSES